MSKVESIKNHQKVYYSPKIAIKYSLDFAIVFQHLYFNITKNKKHNVKGSLRDGEHWYYSTYKNIASETGLKKATVGRVTRELIKSCVLKTSTKYNRFKHEKLLWFAKGNLKGLYGDKDDEIYRLQFQEVNDFKPKQALLLKTIRYLVSDNKSTKVSIEELAYYTNVLTKRNTGYALKKLIKDGLISVETNDNLSEIMFTNDIFREESCTKKFNSCTKNEPRKTEVTEVKEIKEEHCFNSHCGKVHNKEKENRCSNINNLNFIVGLDNRLDEGFVKFALKEYGFEKVRKVVNYAKNQDIKSTLGGFVRKALKENYIIPEVDNVNFAKEYSYKYYIKIRKQYVIINKNIELYFNMDSKQFREQFLHYIQQASIKKTVCYKHNKRLAEELREISPYSVKSLDDYQVVVNSNNSQLILSLRGKDTENNLNILINRQIKLINEDTQTIESILGDEYIEAIIKEKLA